MTLARLAFLAALTGAVLMNAASAQTHVTLATATPGGGFPFFGDNAAAVINETDKTLLVETKNTKGSTENIGLLNDRKIDIALVAGEPAYEAFQGIGQGEDHGAGDPGDLFQSRHVRGARRQPGEDSCAI